MKSLTKWKWSRNLDFLKKIIANMDMCDSQLLEIHRNLFAQINNNF